MRTPSQALAWSNFSLCWPTLVTQIAGAMLVVFLVDLALDPGEDFQSLISVIDLILIISLTFLYGVTVNSLNNSGKMTTALGFPYKTEFSLPVETWKLTVVPLMFYCAMTQIAVFTPLTILNYFYLNVEISYIPISFFVFQFTIIPLMLSWWTQSGSACLLGWLVTLALFWYGLLLPDFNRIENTWIVETSSADSYVMPLIVTTLMLLITYIGVRHQRSGEALLEIRSGTTTRRSEFVVRDLLPISTKACPTSSSLQAELWKEQVLNGSSRAIFSGLTGALVSMTILGIIDFFAPGASSIQTSNLSFLSFGLYFAICMALTITMYGVKYIGGTAVLSVHSRTTPLSTARLASIRVGTALTSVALACFVMGFATFLLGPLFNDSFVDLRSLVVQSITDIFNLGLGPGALRIFLSVVAFYTFIAGLATVLTWFMLLSRNFAIGLVAVCAYAFLTINGLMIFFRDSEGYHELLDAVLSAHLWIPTIFIPLAIVLMLRQLLDDWVISAKHAIVIIGIGCLVQTANLIWLFGEANYNVTNLDISTTVLSYLIAQGFLPLLVIFFSLWTSNKIRHA